MCQKAGKQMGALARLSNVFNQKTKILLMQSFILSHFLYCSVVYHYCSRSDIIKLEKVQKKSLRFRRVSRNSQEGGGGQNLKAFFFAFNFLGGGGSAQKLAENMIFSTKKRSKI